MHGRSCAGRLALSVVGTCAFAGPPAPKTPGVGAVAPDFTTTELMTGHAVHLGGQRGKLVFLSFWATWCEPCRKELPILNNVQKIVADRGGVVYAVSFAELASTFDLKQVFRTAGWQLTPLMDPGGKIAALYGIKTIPLLFIIGRDGKILAARPGSRALTGRDIPNTPATGATQPRRRSHSLVPAEAGAHPRRRMRHSSLSPANARAAIGTAY